MLKSILKLEGAQSLSKENQKEINGGMNLECVSNSDCSFGYECIGCYCVTGGLV